MDLIKIRRLGISITLNCPLKCRMCLALSPYVKEYNPTFDFLKQQVDGAFQIIDKAELVVLTGGEPFLRGTEKDFTLGNFMDYLCETHADKFDIIEVNTMGVVPLSDELIEAFKRVNNNKTIRLLVSDYGTYSPRIAEIIKKLNHNGIEYNLYDHSKDLHCGGWVDLRPSTEEMRDSKQAKELFGKCAYPQIHKGCFLMLDGAIWACVVSLDRYLCGEVDKDNTDCINVFGDKDQMRKKIADMAQFIDPFDACSYCFDGLCSNSKRFIPAEQISNKEEIEEWRRIHKMRL